MKYYSTLRPVGIGTFPKPTGNKVIKIENFDKRIFVSEINHEAWGFIEYENPLSEKDADSYDLVAEDFYLTEVVESCPHCGCDNIFSNYNAVANGYKATCWNCGATIMLCDECLHADDNKGCDWHGTYKDGWCYGKCFRGETKNRT